jgi:hypothetical protein
VTFAIIIAVIVLMIVIGTIMASRGGNAAQVRQLNRRTWEAQRQIHDIGQRTRAAIQAEAIRRRQQGGR